MLTLEYLKAVLDYDSETGIFKWLIDRRGSAKAGDLAGSLDPDRYWRIKINGVYYKAHRLAFLYMTGEWPENLVDHKNTIRTDNKWENLREANYSQNSLNAKVKKNNRLGVKGIFKTKNGEFTAVLKIGPYDTIEEAKRTYDQICKIVHGEFFNSG